MNKLSVIVPTLILLTAAFAAHSVANPQNQPPSQSLPSHEAQFTAISVVRTINTAEAGYAFSTKRDSSQPRRRYATWPELYASGIFEEMKRSTPKVLSLMNADGVEGYNLALI